MDGVRALWSVGRLNYIIRGEKKPPICPISYLQSGIRMCGCFRLVFCLVGRHLCLFVCVCLVHGCVCDCVCVCVVEGADWYPLILAVSWRRIFQERTESIIIWTK